MVILQFNKLIRNKWVWGVFAIAISLFFAFDFLIDDISAPEERSTEGAGTLAGENVDAKVFSALVEDIRGLGQQRDWKTPQDEINRRAWENYAALVVAGKAGVEATDAEVRAMIRRDPSFQQNGAFSFALYQNLLRQNSLVPERFEEMLKRRLTLGRIGREILGSAAWASPMELDQAVADMTDVFTVKVARFTQDKKAADAIKIDDAGLKKWYDEHVKELELPERIKIRFVKFNALEPAVLAKMVVTEEEMRDRYDVTVDKYTSTDTNGVEVVKKFEEVKAGIEKELRQIAAVQFYETNLNQRVYGGAPAKAGASRLDEIAASEKKTVETSDWFSIEGGYQEGFMKGAWSICPGAKGFNEVIAELDSSSDDLRYGIVSSETAVWLVEKAEVSAKHTPTFAEAKGPIARRALQDLKADTFKKSIEAIAAKGAKAVLATKNVSTNITFAVADLKSAAFEDQMAVARAVMKIKKGEVSEFAPTGTGKGLLVVCEDRVAGDAAKAMVLKSQVNADVTMLQQRQIPEAWLKWNLERLGFVTGEISSVEKVDVEE